MITIMLSGRLGNNLFQYSFGLVASKKLKTSFIFNTSEIEKYFELGSYNSLFIKKIRTLKYMLSLKFNKWESADLNLDIKPNELLAIVRNHTVIYGYFQSEDFFKNDAKLVRRHFKIKEIFLNNFKEKYGLLFQKPTVCVAIRLTDYIHWKIDKIDDNTPELNFDYFKNLISKINNIQDKNLIFISDDLESVKLNMNYNNATYVAGEIDQMITLTLSDELIISNSTFHWWGAWLNNKPNKVIYAPQYWLGHKVKREYPQNIIPPDWIQMEVLK